MKISISTWIGVTLATGAVLVACSLISLWNQSLQEMKRSVTSAGVILDGNKSRDVTPDIGGAEGSSPMKLADSQKSSAVLTASNRGWLVAVNTPPSGNQNLANQTVSKSTGIMDNGPTGAGPSHQSDPSNSAITTKSATMNSTAIGVNQAFGTMGLEGRNAAEQKSYIEGVVPVTIPAAFGDPSAATNLSESDKAQISQIANDFTKTVQATGVAPNSPEYQQVWDTAAQRADEYYRGQFGIPAFNAAQLAGRVAAQKN